MEETHISYNRQHITTRSLVELWIEWEIRFMVLLSFTLQLFLFFTGGLRRHHTNMFFRLPIWLSYLGADLVAIYALGLLSQYPSASARTNTMAFFWAPFLLVHLGGQDTITAFSIEDNNLWLRHLLNLLVQVGLALYVFWNSSARGNSQLLAPAIFMFVAGVIKYGERTWALKCGNQNGLWISSTNDDVNNKELPVEDESYSGLLCYALNTAPFVRGIFAGRTIFQMGSKARDKLYDDFTGYEGQIEGKLKILEMELGLMYDVLYTKAMVTQTLVGSILRCVAQISVIVAFVLFLLSNKERHSKIDVELTYALFIGGLFMEVCSFFMVLLSPWTWAYLKERRCECLAHLSWSLFKTIQPETRRWWSSSIGQYNFIRSLACDRSTSAARIISKIMNATGLEDIWRIFRHTKHVKAKMDVVACVVEWSEKTTLQKVPDLGEALEYILHEPFENSVLQLHLFTDWQIRTYQRSTSAEDQLIASNEEVSNLINICEKISNYMLYLLVFYPSMLPVSGSAQDTLELFSRKITCTREEDILKELRDKGLSEEQNIFARVNSLLDYAQTPRSFRDSLVEIKEMWIRLLVYAACKSRPEMHAQHLGKGGELLTFVWLHMGAHYAFGDIARRLDLISPSAGNEGAAIFVEDRWAPVQGNNVYLFDFRSRSQE